MEVLALIVGIIVGVLFRDIFAPKSNKEVREVITGWQFALTGWGKARELVEATKHLLIAYRKKATRLEVIIKTCKVCSKKYDKKI